MNQSVKETYVLNSQKENNIHVFSIASKSFVIYLL